jgi:hypothetical protein
MSLAHNNLILLRKWHILFAISFCALFYTILSPASFATPEEELVRLEEQLKENSLNPDELIEKLIRINVDNDKLIEQRNELVKLVLSSGANVDQFLEKVVQQQAYDLNQCPSNYNELVYLALKNGADPNSIMIFSMSNRLDPKTLELLFNNNHKKMDSIDKFFKLIYVDGKHAQDPLYNYNKKYKNLNAKASATPKIPRVIHHIWLTNNNQRKEISEEDIKHVLKTKEVFSQSEHKWEHTVWTNNKNLIPASVEILESRGIQVREMSEVEYNLRLSKNIRELIEQELWGMASDALRYDLLYYLGGVYADLNFVFTRDVEKEIHTYDFFSHSVTASTMENSFFGAKANHPILNEALNLVDNNLNNLDLITQICKTNSSITDIATFNPINTAYYIAANSNTTDVMYPDYRHNDVEENTLPLSQEKWLEIIKKYTNFDMTSYTEANNHLENNKICGSKNFFYGEDTKIHGWHE